MICGYTQRDEALGGYSLKNPLDGLHEWRIFAISEAQEFQVTVNGGTPEKHPAKPAGVWKRLGSVFLPKGEHVVDILCDEPLEKVMFANLPLEDDQAVAMAWGNRTDQIRFKQERIQYTIHDVRLLRRHGFIMHQPRDTQSLSVPSGMPMGSLGAGKVEMALNGQLTAFTGNNNQDSPIYRMPGSYFAIGVKGNSLCTCRVLQTAAVDQEMIPACSVHCDASYPVARWTYNVNPIPLEISCTAWSSHVPGDAAASSVPAAWFEFTIKNHACTPMEAALCFSWENLINVGGSMKYTSNSERVLPLCYHTWNASYVWSDRRKNHAEALDGAVRFYADEDLGNPASFGEHLIWCSDPNTLVFPDRSLEDDELVFADSLSSCFALPVHSTPGSEFRAGAVASVTALQPGEETKVRFILAWHMPNQPTTHGDAGVNYSNRFRDVQEVLRYAMEHGDALREKSETVANFLKQSDLPAWFIKRLLNDRFVSATNTWYDKNGYFSVNEAPTGMGGCHGTLDQRAASQGFWCTFFPELDENELESFRLAQGDDGQPSHDIGFSEIEHRTTRHTKWPDLSAAYVQQVYRHWQRTGDDAFARRHYPHVKKAIEWAVAMDETGCGIPYIKKGRGTTYDHQHWEGVNAFIASVHMAMLYLAGDMAERLGEPEAEHYLNLASRAAESRMNMLWDEQRRRFRNAYVTKTGELDQSTFIASLAGEWYLLSAGLKSPIDKTVMKDAVRGILEDCYSDTGLTDQGGRPETPAFMQYPAAYYCAPAMLLGCADEAWRAMELNDRVITASPSNHFIQGLTYWMDGAARWALPYYMTSVATWNLLEAMAGVIPDLRDNTLSISPAIPGKIPVFTQDSWFMLESDEHALHLTPLRSIRPHSFETLVIDGKPRQIPCGFDPGRQSVSFTRE